MDVVVVGAGVLGAALARALAQESHDVTLVDQFEPGDVRAASHASTRILRLAHGDNVDDTRSAWLARQLWKELERERHRRLFAEVGMAWLATGGSTWEEDGQATLRAEGVGFERLTPEEARSLLPDLRVDDIDHVLFEPQAGLLLATEAVQALVESAVDAGVSIRRGRAMADGPTVELDAGRLEGDRIVWACGAWTPSLFPELVRGAVIQQDVCYFETGEQPAASLAPAWGESSCGATGSGEFEGYGFKVGLDLSGPPVDPDSHPRTPVVEQETDARAYLARRFPRLAEARLLRSETCQTVILEPSVPPTTLLGGEVRLLQHPEHDCVWLLGDGSGHAFKHAPAIASATRAILGSTQKGA